MGLKPAPVDKEAEFRLSELFFSTTDRKGVIGFGNDVFTRISGYRSEELVGSPHSIIRHPDMPAAVFQLIWEYLKNGKRAAGYVKNLAANGSYYWVCAVITPIDGGYLSIRLKPTSALFSVVQELYKQMRGLELQTKAEGGTSADGMKQSRACLEAAVKGAGFSSYDALMQEILLQEVRGRKQRLAAGAGHAPGTPAVCGGGRWGKGYECRGMRGEVSQMFDKLGAISSLEESLGQEMGFIRRLGADLHLISLNAQVRTAGLQEEGRTLQTVAQQIGHIARAISGSTEDVCRRMGNVTGELKAAAAEIATSDLSVEMIRNFVKEGGEDRAGHDPRIAELAQVVRQTLDRAGESVVKVTREIQKLSQVLAEFMKEIRTLEILHVTGKVEAVRSRENQNVSVIFDEVTVKAREARGRLSRITELAERAGIKEPNREVIEADLTMLAA